MKINKRYLDLAKEQKRKLIEREAELEYEMLMIDNKIEDVKRMYELQNSPLWDEFILANQKATGLNEYETDYENGLVSLEVAIEDYLDGEDSALDWRFRIFVDTYISSIKEVFTLLGGSCE